MPSNRVPSTANGSKSRPPRWKSWLSALTVAVLSSLGGLLAAAPASAVPVYEIDGRWAPDTPTVMATGEVVTAEWRVNVNDSEAAPSNDPVDNVTFTVTLVNGTFSALPDVCLTTNVDPISSITADGSTLECNLGTQDQGSAHVIQTAIQADGQTGDEVSASATIDDQTAEVSPIVIENPFAMDIQWQSPTNTVVWADDYVDVDLQWTLFLQRGSDPGPDSVSYTLDVTNAVGAPIEIGPDGCTAFTAGGASGHPWSGGDHPAEQLAPFATCALTPTGTPGEFTLTLSDIDYSQTQVPASDSTGQSLPLDRAAIASGSVWFRILSGANNSLTLESDAPSYTAPGGGTAEDDPANNQSNKSWTRGGWSNAWQPEASGIQTPSWWSDEFRVSPGTAIQSVTNAQWGLGDAAADAEFGQCVVMDTRYIDYRWSFIRGNWSGPDIDAEMAYYVGADPLVTPDSTSYDPNAFRCDSDPDGWTTTEPTDLTTVRAVRATYPFSAVDGIANVALTVGQQVQDDTPVGQDVWQWGAALVNGEWQHPNRSMNPDDRGAGPLTLDARYPFLGSGRDIVRIIGVIPDVTKSVDRTSVKPGIPVTYTLTYTANGTGAIDPTVDDYTLVDTLPEGVTYVPESAAAEPEIDLVDGQQRLTWVLDDVPTNTNNTLSYQAVVDASVPPATRLTNTVTSAVGGETSGPATAQVTVSTNGTTLIGKTTDQAFIANPDGSGDGEGSWTVTLRSEDPLPQAFTDTIDILPYNGDGRGTEYEGSYTVSSVTAAETATVYYTDADVDLLSDDPADPSNGAAGDPDGNTVGWSIEPIDQPTAIRVIDGVLAPGASTSFVITIATEGADSGDVWVNRAQARAEHTELVMRTSEPLEMGSEYSASLKKYVQDADGEWHDAQDASDYPQFHIGDTVRYRVVVENTGEGTLTGIEVSDDQQPELGAFTIDTLEAGESEIHEYEIVLEDTGGASLVNTACATADQPADADTAPEINCDPAGVDVTNYTVVKTAEQPDGSVVQPGETITYTVTVTQEGSAPAVAEFTDDLAEVLDDAGYNQDLTADIGDAEFIDGDVVWSGTVPVGGTATVTYSVTVKTLVDLAAEGDYSLRNVVFSDGCIPVDGEFPDCTTGHSTGGYVYSKTSDPAPGSMVEPGQVVTYTVQIEQIGQAESPDATVTDDLSAVLDDATYNNDATATAGAVEFAGQALAWTGDLAVGDVVTLTYSVTVVEQGDGTLLNVVTSPDERSSCVPAPDDNPDCTTTHEKAAVPALPQTGVDLADVLAPAAALILLGLGMLTVRRRRTTA